MKLLPYICVLFVAVYCCVLPHGAIAQFRFEKAIVLNKEQGLAANHVRAIRKGPDGFIWIGTPEGLCRFDGQQFKTFRVGTDLQYTLYDNTVNSVLPLRNEVWAATNQGISVLDIRQGTFRHYQIGAKGKMDSLTKDFDYGVNTIVDDRKGNIWIGTIHHGLWRYDAGKDNFINYPYPAAAYPYIVPVLGSNNHILSIEPSRTNDSIIYAGTLSGLEEINTYTGKVRWYVYPQKDKAYQSGVNVFRRMYHHTDGLLYVGNWSAGMHTFDPKTGALTPLPVSDRWQTALNGSIGTLYAKSDHELWVTTVGALAVYDTDLKDVTWARFNNPQKELYYGIHCIDERNRVWYGSINGIQYFDPTMQQFSTYSFHELYGMDWAYAQHIISDKLGRTVTVCPIQANGIYVFDRISGEWTRLAFKGVNVPAKLEVYSVSSFPDGRLAISSNKGLFTYNKTTQVLQPLIPPPTRFRQLRDIVVDKRGRIWLGAGADGLIRWEYPSNQFKNYDRFIWPNDTSKVGDRVVNLYEDSRGNIWFTRNSGMGVYLAVQDSIINFGYKDGQSNSFPFVHRYMEDGSGRMWALSNAGWLGYALVSNPAGGVVTKYYLPDKQVQGRVYGLARDPQGHLWGFSDKQLFRIQKGDTAVTTFNFDYGVKDPDFFHISFLPSGGMVLGGRNSLVLANMEQFKRNDEMPVPYISELHVLNQPYTMPPVFGDSALELSHQRNFFTVGFSAQAYTLPNEVKFRYRLAGFDDWKEVTGRGSANYTNVPPGNYVFQLQAANNEGVWNKKMVQLAMHIATPWYKTWWFYLLSFVVISALVYWLYRMRIGQVRKKEQLKAQYEKKLANVEMSALLAQMNPHFLFNCLNSIDSYIIKNESRKASEYLNSFARLMRLILQNSRSNYISLKDEIETLELYLQMEGLRFRDQFQYEIRIMTETDTGSIVIPPMLIQPYVENAIWHGLMNKNDGTPRKVNIQIEERDNNLYCVIQDNGVGREKAQVLRTQKLSGKRRSMGMQITKDRMEIINKLYDVQTCVKVTDLTDEGGQALGTRVELVIPL
ncbi:sensor histidine kinase [Paraflavitalea sp. CAU 1676]|uniref:sensor histidine kinase n=1 Tax=Paraflavitalea sp. CAU 1676 TaxID=3032598 RepID=UPI0023DB0019|nr:sensor histidine kinase [Paraflavitalea sp. CAU 1676]MDF2192897.1 histidine kinase [Paraflavitalea sp. CAU 1676]